MAVTDSASIFNFLLSITFKWYEIFYFLCNTVIEFFFLLFLIMRSFLFCFGLNTLLRKGFRRYKCLPMPHSYWRFCYSDISLTDKPTILSYGICDFIRSLHILLQLLWNCVWVLFGYTRTLILFNVYEWYKLSTINQTC